MSQHDSGGMQDEGPMVFVEGICLRPDLNNLEITSKTVETMLEPLVMQVSINQNFE